MKALYPIDLNQNEIKNAVIQNLTGAPGSPLGGQIYTNTAGGAGNYTLQFHNGSTFVTLSSGAGSGTVTSVSVSATPSWLTASVATPSSTPAISLTATTGLTANQVLATPNGASGAVSLRSLAAADLPALNSITAPTGDVSLNSHKITSLADPTASTDAATKNYVDLAMQGATDKFAVRVVATTNVNTASAPTTIDGVTLAANDRVLLQGQTTASQNGIYVFNGAASAMTRATDMDAGTEFSGALVAVQAGTNSGSLWLCTNNGTVTVGTTSITFVEINKAADLQAGTGITISGNTISVATSYAGGTSITTVGTIGTGTWQGTLITVGFGGTGASTAAGARTNLGAPGKYTQLIGDGSSTAITINQGVHGLNAGVNHVQVFDASTGELVGPKIVVDQSTGNVTLTFTTAPASNAYRVLILG